MEVRFWPAAMVSAVLLVCGCTTKSQAEDFARKYLESMMLDTGFYQLRTIEKDLEIVQIARRKVAGPFEVSRIERVASGEYEAFVIFSNGTKGYVAVFPHNGELFGAFVLD